MLAALAEDALPPNSGVSAREPTIQGVREHATAVARETEQRVSGNPASRAGEGRPAAGAVASRPVLDFEGDPSRAKADESTLWRLEVGEGGEPSIEGSGGDRAGGRAAFDLVMSLIMEAWNSDPGTHVYH